MGRRSDRPALGSSSNRKRARVSCVVYVYRRSRRSYQMTSCWISAEMKQCTHSRLVWDIICCNKRTRYVAIGNRHSATWRSQFVELFVASWSSSQSMPQTKGRWLCWMMATSWPRGRLFSTDIWKSLSRTDPFNISTWVTGESNAPLHC